MTNKETFTLKEESELSPSTETIQDSSSEKPLDISNSQDLTTSSREETSKKPPSPNINLAVFQDLFSRLETPEEKLASAIEFMKNTLSQNNTPSFKNFWEVRKICLPLFKENIATSTRFKLWKEYSELSKEARYLKDILDEQSAFAVEQINVAINSLENDINSIVQNTEKMPPFSLPTESQTLLPKLNIYNQLQCELNLFNTYATRLNSLRKELIKTEMRIRQKNQFFHVLSTAGDKIFPRRKEAIKKISAQFIEDVDFFISKNFSENTPLGNLFFLREEIKALQAIAKVLTLNTNSFTTTRAKLSECWDKVKFLEKSRKKEKAQKRALFKQNLEQVEKKLEDYAKDRGERLDAPNEEWIKSLNDIIAFMKTLELHYDDVKVLKEKIAVLRKVILDQENQDELERQSKEEIRKDLKKKQFAEIKEKIDCFLQKTSNLEIELIHTEKAKLSKEIYSANLLSKSNKSDLERLFHPLRDIIAEKKEQALMEMPEGDRQSLEKLKNALEERERHRQEIKAQLEDCRKSSASSGLDFEKAIAYKELTEEKKLALEKVDKRIKELKSKISTIESQL